MPHCTYFYPSALPSLAFSHTFQTFHHYVLLLPLILLVRVITLPNLLPFSIVALLDLADEQLGCTALIIALDKNSPMLAELLHALMYVGGTVVSEPPFQTDPLYVLVGMEI